MATSPEKPFFSFKQNIGKCKHAILKRYLQAFIAILTRNKYKDYQNIIYIDGFAGPGKYDDGEDGSPIVALKLVFEHENLPANCTKIMMFFIEKDVVKANELRRNLDITKSESINSKNYSKLDYTVLDGEFATRMDEILKMGIITLSTPLFVFADPFGFNGAYIPMPLMRKVLAASNKAELFINVMDGFAQRFFQLDSRAQAINLLMGTANTEWKTHVLEGDTPAKRRELFINFYIEQLKAESNVDLLDLKFSMRDENNRHKYHLVFVTQHPKGLLEMKRSMHTNTQYSADLIFSEFNLRKGHNLKESKEDRYNAIKDLILKNFAGMTNVSGAGIRDFVLMGTIYVFNEALKLKKEWADRIMNSECRQFDNTLFDFCEVELDEAKFEIEDD